MAQTTDFVELIEFSGEEIEVVFFGDISTEESGHDAGEHFGVKYASTMQTHDVVEVIEWDRSLYSLTDNDTIQQHLDRNREQIENDIIVDFQRCCNDRF